MKTFILLVLTVSLWSGVYDYRYSPEKGVPQEDVNNTFFTSDFERIVRYSPIVYTPSDPIKIDQSFKDDLEDIHTSIEAYSKSKSNYSVVVIAHTRDNKDSEMAAIQESTFFGSLHDYLFESHADDQENRNVCDRVLTTAKQQLIDRGVDGKKIVLECRSGEDPLYLENDKDARDRNYYLRVTLYQSK
jgi:hypothetical protein